MTSFRINKILNSICKASEASGVFIESIVFSDDICAVRFVTMDKKKAYAFVKSYDEASRCDKLGFNADIYLVGERYSFTST